MTSAVSGKVADVGKMEESQTPSGHSVMMKRGRGGREGRWNDRHKSSCDRREREQMYCLIVKQSE